MLTIFDNWFAVGQAQTSNHAESAIKARSAMSTLAFSSRIFGLTGRSSIAGVTR
jgi:hypothetical protein